MQETVKVMPDIDRQLAEVVWRPTKTSGQARCPSPAIEPAESEIHKTQSQEPELGTSSVGIALFDLNISCFIYMKRDWAEHRCYVKALS